MPHPLPKALLLALSLGLAACGGEGPADTQSPAAGTGAAEAARADSTFSDLDGNPLALADFQGSKVFLNYWATWCAPCIREIPAINRAEAALADEGYVFLLASDEDLEQIRGFLAEREFEGRFIKLNGFFSTQGVEAVPSTVLYGENGELLQTWLGAYEWDSPEMLAELRAAAGGEAPQ